VRCSRAISPVSVNALKTAKLWPRGLGIHWRAALPNRTAGRLKPCSNISEKSRVSRWPVISGFQRRTARFVLIEPLARSKQAESIRAVAAMQIYVRIVQLSIVTKMSIASPVLSGPRAPRNSWHSLKPIISPLPSMVNKRVNLGSEGSIYLPASHVVHQRREAPCCEAVNAQRRPCFWVVPSTGC